MMHTTWWFIGEVPYYFSMWSVNFHGHKGQKLPVLTRTGRELWLQCELTDGLGMMHNAWRNINEVPYCQISRPHRTKCRLWPEIGLIHGYEMKHKAWTSIEELSYLFLSSSAKFKGHTRPKIANFDLNWAFPGCNSSLNSLMALK